MSSESESGSFDHLGRFTGPHRVLTALGACKRPHFNVINASALDSATSDDERGNQSRASKLGTARCWLSIERHPDAIAIPPPTPGIDRAGRLVSLPPTLHVQATIHSSSFCKHFIVLLISTSIRCQTARLHCLAPLVETAIVPPRNTPNHLSMPKPVLKDRCNRVPHRLISLLAILPSYFNEVEGMLTPGLPRGHLGPRRMPRLNQNCVLLSYIQSIVTNKNGTNNVGPGPRKHTRQRWHAQLDPLVTLPQPQHRLLPLRSPRRWQRRPRRHQPSRHRRPRQQRPLQV